MRRWSKRTAVTFLCCHNRSSCLRRFAKRQLPSNRSRKLNRGGRRNGGLHLSSLCWASDQAPHSDRPLARRLRSTALGAVSEFEYRAVVARAARLRGAVEIPVGGLNQSRCGSRAVVAAGE